MALVIFQWAGIGGLYGTGRTTGFYQIIPESVFKNNLRKKCCRTEGYLFEGVIISRNQCMIRKSCELKKSLANLFY